MNMKRIIALVLVMLSVASLLCACNGQPQETQSANANYKVSVISPEGKPMTDGVAVRFKKGGAQVALAVVDAGGTVTREMAKDDYTVELVFTGETEYAYDLTNLSLSATKTELEIVLLNYVGKRGQQLSVQVDEQGDELVKDRVDYSSYYVAAGRTEVELEAGDRVFFLFAPEKSGTYHFTVEDNKGTISYHGDPNNVLYYNAGNKVEGQENVISVTVKGGSVGSPHVICITAPEGATTGILNIAHVAELPPPIPVTNYEMTADLKPYVHPVDAEVAQFDLSKEYTLVLNEEDGYYHLNTADGPLVLVRMGHNADSVEEGVQYYLNSIYSVTRMDPFYKYIFDDKGDAIEMVNYMPCLEKYLECELPENGRDPKPTSYTYVDALSGLYPLTEDLKFIIQERGNYLGWWNPESNYYLFNNPDAGFVSNLNVDSAWLFYCCYIVE